MLCVWVPSIAQCGNKEVYSVKRCCSYHAWSCCFTSIGVPIVKIRWSHDRIPSGLCQMLLLLSLPLLSSWLIYVIELKSSEDLHAPGVKVKMSFTNMWWYKGSYIFSSTWKPASYNAAEWCTIQIHIYESLKMIQNIYGSSDLGQSRATFAMSLLLLLTSVNWD